VPAGELSRQGLAEAVGEDGGSQPLDVAPVELLPDRKLTQCGGQQPVTLLSPAGEVMREVMRLR
jgi:hypothetical protein